MARNSAENHSHDRVLLVISSGYGNASGPSTALFHMLRGISKYFRRVYVINTIWNYKNIDITFYRDLPYNVKIFNILIYFYPQTMSLLSSSIMNMICLKIAKIIDNLKSKHKQLYLVVMSDIFNFKALTKCQPDEYYVGYNVFFNFAPPSIMIRQKVSMKNVFDVIEKIEKITFSTIYRFIDLQLTNYVGHIVAHTNYHKLLYLKFLNIPSQKISVIPHMIDLEYIRRFSCGNTFRNFTFVFGGGKSIEKGAYFVIKAFKRFLKYGIRDVQLIFVGNLPIFKDLKDIREKVVFVKRLPYSKYLCLLGKAHAVLIPSQNELFGMTILESLALGKFVIASRVGGIPEILGNDYPLLINPADEEDLAIAMLKVYEEARSKYVADYLIERIRKFNIENVSPRLYENIILHAQYD